jgi:hypothetical protein
MENDRDILLIAIFTFFTVFAWISFELAQTSRTSTINQATQSMLAPLNSTIDKQTLSIINSRINYK